MNFRYVVVLYIIVLTYLFHGCSSDNSVVAPADTIDTGEADFSSFVVIGNSISAGFQSNSLYKSAQEYSYGNLIAGKVKTHFIQPLISDPGTGGRIELKSINPFKPQINLNKGSQLFNAETSFNNFGIPGAYVYDVVNAYDKATSYPVVKGGSGNELFDLILRGKGTQFSQAKSLNPTLLIIWIGNNDILGHALSGGVSAYTPVPEFEKFYRQLTDSIASLKADIIIGNIPDISIIPYFTFVGELLKTGGTNMVWGITGNGDTTLMDLNKNYVTLMAYIEEVYDVSGTFTGRGTRRDLPIRNKYILDEKEAAKASEIVNQYNSIIASIAAEKGFFQADFNSMFKKIKAAESSGGYKENGVVFTTEYYYGNLFSLDGVHPSNMGQALIANELIRLINLKLKAVIPLININEISNNFMN